MSEYAGLPRSKSLKDLDNTGTLFEGLDQPESHARKLGGRAVRSSQIIEHPQTIEGLKARHHLGEHADERESAYHELGGNRTEYDNLSLFDQLAEDFQPWMTDVDLAMNHYGLHEQSPETIQAMTKADQKKLALHVDALMARMATAHRLIGATEGNVSEHQFLERRYGARRTPEEMIAYMPVLEKLNRAIHEQHVLNALHQAAPELFKLTPHERNERYGRNIRKYGHVQTGYDRNHKLRTEQPKQTDRP